MQSGITLDPLLSAPTRPMLAFLPMELLEDICAYLPDRDLGFFGSACRATAAAVSTVQADRLHFRTRKPFLEAAPPPGGRASARGAGSQETSTFSASTASPMTALAMLYGLPPRPGSSSRQRSPLCRVAAAATAEL